MACLGPRLNNNTPWTLMHEPTYYTLCKFHTDPRGNRCAKGQLCEFMHVQQLHRPSIQEMTLSTLLTLNYFLSLFVTHFQHQNLHHPPSTSPANGQQTALNANATTYIPLSEPVGGMHFEPCLELDCKLDIDDVKSDFLDAEIDNSSATELLSAKPKVLFDDDAKQEMLEKSPDDLKDGDHSQSDGKIAIETSVDLVASSTAPPRNQKWKKQWLFLLANDQEALLDTYPELADEYAAKGAIGNKDGY